MRVLCTFIATALICALGMAQQMSMSDLLKSNTRPTKMAVKDMPADFYAVKITSTGGDYMSAMMPMMLFGMVGAAGGDVVGAYSASWTSGEVINVEGSRFLVTYKAPLDYAALSRSGGAQPDGGSLGLPSELILELVKVEAISTLTPLPHVTKQTLLGTATMGGNMQDLPESNIAARKSATLSNMKQVALAMVMYAGDYDDELPYAQNTATVQQVTMPYARNMDIWKTQNPAGGRILFNMALAGVSMVAIEEPANTPMFFDEKPWPDGSRVVAYTDGHAKVVNAQGWAEVERMLKKRWKRKGKPLPVPPPGVIMK